MVSKNRDLLSIIESFANRKVVVLGEAMLDSYLHGTAERLCQEAPVPIVDVRETIYAPGGAANTAANLSHLGAQVTFLSVIGDDEPGSRLLNSLEQLQVDTKHVLRVPNRRTLAKQRILAGAQIMLRFDQGSVDVLDAETEAMLIERLDLLFDSYEALVVSDYNYGLITRGLLQKLQKLQKDDPRVIVIDSKQLPAYQLIGATAVKANYDETVQLLRIKKLQNEKDRIKQIGEEGPRALDLTGAQIAAITLDQSGAMIFRREDKTPYRTYAEPKPNSQASGAGDTFVSALALSLTAGAQPEQAAEIASAAASVAVSRSGTSVCALEELKEHFFTHEKLIQDLFQLVLQVTLYRRAGHRIVFTNGCFDILHTGHIAYLNRAKALGDFLIVGLNSDRSIRKIKGPDRPINPLEDRAQVLAALSCVDHIVPFDEDTPHDLIGRIKPDIFVKGGDYTRHTLPEASLVEQLGGRVEILPYLESYSTTSVIQKIRHLVARG